MFNAATNTAWGGTERPGAKAYDTAQVSGASGMTPTGTVTYTFYPNGDCTGRGGQVAAAAPWPMPASLAELQRPGTPGGGLQELPGGLQR